MKSPRIYLVTFTLLFITCQMIHAQQSFHSTGSTQQGQAGEVSFSLGQVFYTPASKEKSVSQGVQQTYIIKELSVKDRQSIDIDVTVYPNPVRENLSIKLNASDNENTFYVLTDMNGKLLEKSKIEDGTQNLAMMRFTQSVYILTIYQDDSPVRTFKIIKN